MSIDPNRNPASAGAGRALSFDRVLRLWRLFRLHPVLRRPGLLGPQHRDSEWAGWTRNGRLAFAVVIIRADSYRQPAIPKFGSRAEMVACRHHPRSHQANTSGSLSPASKITGEFDSCWPVARILAPSTTEGRAEASGGRRSQNACRPFPISASTRSARITATTSSSSSTSMSSGVSGILGAHAQPQIPSRGTRSKRP